MSNGSGPGWLGLPGSLWSRVLVLFLGLVAVKIGMLAGLGKHLHEVHYRIGSRSVNWVNAAAFSLFLALGVGSLVLIARHCQRLGLKAVRSANAAVLGLGLLFIFLTFHNGDKNYIYPIMSGILDWKSLGPYLSLDLCFRPPYLAAWVFSYAAVYYILTRTGRESWTLYLTALCAGLYGAICLRELSFCRNELLTADCLGVASLLTAWQGRGRLRSVWLLVPAGWVLFVWALFRFTSAELGDLNPYFTLLVGESIVLFAAVTLWARRSGYLAAWRPQLPFYFTAFLLLASGNYPMADNYNNLLCLGLELPRYFLGELMLAGAVGLGAALYCRLWPKARLWWLDALNVVLLALAFVDLRLSEIIGVRLEWSVLSFGNSPKMMWRMAKPYLPGAALGVLIAIGLYVAALRLCRVGRASAPAGRVRWFGPGPCYAAASFILLGLLGWTLAKPDKARGQTVLRLAQTSPLWQRTMNRPLSPEEFRRQARALGLGEFQQPLTATQPRRDLNVLLVFMESSFNRHLSLFGAEEETQPLLSKYKDRMELYPNFFSCFAGSIHARFATFTSLYPIRNFNAFTLERVGVKSIFEVLHENGYACSMFYSSFFDYTGFRDFLKQRGLDEMYDADTMPGERKSERVSWGLPEEETLEAIRSQIRKSAASDRRFFLTYVPAAPHYPYDHIPRQFQKFKAREVGDYTPFYLNELLYMDWVIASIVDELRESGLLEKTLVIVTNDHGEMTGANGGSIGHGWQITPELANTPLIIMDPAKPGYKVNYAIGSQVDLLPTVLDRLGIALPAGQLYEGQSLDHPQRQDGHLAYLNSYQQYAVLEDNRLTFGDRQTEEAGAKKTYAISNQGSKTVFTLQGETDGAPSGPRSIGAFDEFQENLLRNYSVYSQAVPHPAQVASQAHRKP